MTSRDSVAAGADLAAKLEVIAEYAERLRGSGVRYLKIGNDVVMRLEPEFFAKSDKATPEPAYSNLAPLDDPDTFGGAVPHFRRPRRDEDDEAVTDDEE